MPPVRWNLLMADDPGQPSTQVPWPLRIWPLAVMAVAVTTALVLLAVTTQWEPAQNQSPGN
jgi:hypothetical protein